jgi:tetratricopeptide (TPR) repeat protein
MAKDSEKIYRLAVSEMKKENWLDAIALLKQDPVALRSNWRFAWELGWCYFKLGRIKDSRRYLMTATRLVPENATCKSALGQVYLKLGQYKKAELILSEALHIKDSHWTRISLALAYLAQGKLEQAENTHLENIRLKPRQGERYESYAAFLTDVGRAAEAEKMNRRAEELRRVI